MSYLDISNSYAIERNQARVESVQLMYEADKKAEYISNRYGVNVPSYYEYKMDNPVPKPGMQIGTVAQGAAMGTLAGAIVGVVVGDEVMTGLTLLGTGLGAAAGVSARDDGSQAGLKHLQQYNQFIDTVAAELKREHTPGNQIVDVRAERMQPRALEASNERG